MADEIRLDGYKIFVWPEGDAVHVNAVVDELPVVRMAFALSAEEAREIGQWMIDAAEIAERA